MLQHHRLHLDMQLLADDLAHPVHPVPAARAGLLVFGKVMLDALARQIFRQRLAAPLLRLRLLRVRQPRVRNGSRLDIIGFLTFGGGLLGFVENTLRQLLATRRIAMQALQAQLILKMHDALRELLVLDLQRSDLGRVRCDQRPQLLCRGGAIHRILESKTTYLVQNNLRPSPTSPRCPASPRSDTAAPGAAAPPRCRCHRTTSAAARSKASPPPAVVYAARQSDQPRAASSSARTLSGRTTKAGSGRGAGCRRRTRPCRTDPDASPVRPGSQGR